jgi:hypothetical protein
MGVFNFASAITGNAVADFLLGKPATANAAMPLTEQGGVQTSFNEFMQDDWRVNSRLTLNQAPLHLTTNLTNPQFIGLPSFTFPDPGLRTPYVEQVNLSVQREIVRNTVLEVAYVGKFGHKLLYGDEYNPAVYAKGETLSTENNYRIIPDWGSPGIMQTSANSSYNGLQVQATKRYSLHFSVQGAYTYSKAIDQNLYRLRD